MDTTTFFRIGTTCRVVTTPGVDHDRAVQLTADHLDELDLAASHWRDDSELAVLNNLAAREDLDVLLSPLLATCFAAAARAERLTGGLVTPLVGSCPESELWRRPAFDTTGRPVRLLPTPSWNRSRLKWSLEGRRLRATRGARFDLGAAAKADAADRMAALAAHDGGGVLVDLGGDVAAGGVPPQGGWRVGVEGADGELRQVLISTGQAIATSSTVVRARTIAGRAVHHIVDPRTGRVASTPWAMVTVAAANAVEANAASTAAVLLAGQAFDWLSDRGLAARLETVGGLAVATPFWPKANSAAA
ncbi:FAD:protein FMN transferase [Dermacoccaceae bacterium W4C1]